MLIGKSKKAIEDQHSRIASLIILILYVFIDTSNISPEINM